MNGLAIPSIQEVPLSKADERAANEKRIESFLSNRFKRFPAQSRVALWMFRNGLSVVAYKNGGFTVSADLAEVCDTAVAKATRVDRRTIEATIKMIVSNDELRFLFAEIRPTWALEEKVITFVLR